MSSFYNRPTSAQQPAFQFDRVYTSRKELEENYDKDGVMVGRYVMVTYGVVEPHLAYADTVVNNGREVLRGWYYSFTRDNTTAPYFSHPLTPVDGEIYENLKAPDLKSKYWYYKDAMWRQAKEDMTGLTPQDPAYEYLVNIFKDLNAGYTPCPNSVFIKLYSKDKRGYYYKEIASLNEYLPTLDLVMEAPTYDAYENQTWPVTTDQVSEASLRAPFIYKTGLHYNIHLVQPAIYVPGTVNEYNAAGFEAANKHYVTYNQNDNSPVKDHFGIYYNSVRKRWFPYNAASTDPGETQESNDQKERTDKYEVNADFHEIGNAVSNMWDAFYGEPKNQTTSSPSPGIYVTTGQRDTQINTTYAQYNASQASGATQGQQDSETLRGVINSILALIGYDERSDIHSNVYTDEDYTKTNNVIFDNQHHLQYYPGGEVTYDNDGNVIRDTRQLMFNRETLRGLIAEGANNVELLTQLGDILNDANEYLMLIIELLGAEYDNNGNKIEWPDASTVHALVNYILEQVALAERKLGHVDDPVTADTLWGMYNRLKTLNVSDLITLIGAASLPAGGKNILTRLQEAEERIEQLENRGSYWINDNGVMVPSDSFSEIKITKQKLTATNTGNKVRGAMWAQ